MTDPSEEPSQSLAAALARANLSVPDEAIGALESYCKLLWEWNEKINLTRHTTWDKFVGRDVLDTVQLAAHIDENHEVLDVGSGGGVPGILLAILRPELIVTLSESTQKKAKVLDDMVTQLDLPISVFNARAESLLDDFRFDTVTARAVGPLKKLCLWFQPHWLSIGQLLLIKGPKWSEERAEARHLGHMNRLELRRLASYPVEGADGESVILKLTRS